jgi:DUF1016 N-terminal domain
MSVGYARSVSPTRPGAEVRSLDPTIQRRYPTIKGYSASNLWRMSPFFETYPDEPKLAALLRELSWSNNLAIFWRCERTEQAEFSLRLATREPRSKRELERQFNGALFERVVLVPAKVSPPVRQLHPYATSMSKDAYLVDFLDLPAAKRAVGVTTETT